MPFELSLQQRVVKTNWFDWVDAFAPMTFSIVKLLKRKLTKQNYFLQEFFDFYAIVKNGQARVKI